MSWDECASLDNKEVTALMGVISLGGLGLWTIGADLAPLSESRQSVGWPTTTGKIVASSMRHLPRGGIGVPKDRAVIIYSFDVGGRTFRVEGVAIKPTDAQQSEQSWARYPVGKEVTVHYNPEKPSQACLEVGDTSPTALSLLGIVLLGLCLIPAVFFMRFQSRANALRRQLEAPQKTAPEAE